MRRKGQFANAVKDFDTPQIIQGWWEMLPRDAFTSDISVFVEISEPEMEDT